MLSAPLTQQPFVDERFRPSYRFPSPATPQRDPQVERWLADLSPDVAWGDRQRAAKRLGNLRSRDALPGLLAALTNDPFWMVRQAIIQALEKIDDPAAIPILEDVAVQDDFLTIRSYAEKAVGTLSRVR